MSNAFRPGDEDGSEDDSVVDRRLAGEHRALREDLAGFLDLDGGLREVLLEGRHLGLGADVGQVLDLDGGLAAVLPGAEAVLGADGDGSLRRIAGVDPQVRLELRGDPLAVALVLNSSTLLPRARDLALHIGSTSGRRPDMTRALRQARAVQVALFLVGADRVIEDLRSLSGVRRDQRANALDYARSRVRALAQAIDVDLARSLDADPEDGRARDLELNADLEPARGLIRTLSVSLAAEVPAPGVVADAVALAAELARVLIRAVTRALASAVGLPARDLRTPARVAALVDDFTAADLSGADLHNVQLDGLHWSSRTRWPASVDLDTLRSQSLETAPGSGIYVVTRRGTSIGTVPERV